MKLIRLKTSLVAISVFVLAVNSLSAQVTGQSYARVLLPIVLKEPLSGDQGSLWTTEFSLTNTAQVGVNVFPYSTNTTCGECSPPAIPPGSSLRLPVVTDVSPLRGTFLYIDRAHLQDVHLSLRVRDLSRATESWGTSLPIVGEERFVSDTLTIVDIPTGAQFRQTLRIYGLDGSDPTPVQIKLYGRDESATDPAAARKDVLLGQMNTVLAIDPTQVFLVNKDRPAFAEIRSLNAIADITGYKRIRIDVAPLATAKRIWAFVSVTANSTQHVTILEPSRY